MGENYELFRWTGTRHLGMTADRRSSCWTAAAGDHDLVERLADLVNRVYEAEDGLWQDGATRTTAAELHG